MKNMWYYKNVIPKKIFQTHECEYEDLPDFMKAITQTWIKMNPTWEYIYMSAKDRMAYVKEYCPELIDLYSLMSGPFQTDVWRYLILYHNGGAYADMDSICIMPLNKILEEKYTDQEIVCTEIKNIDQQEFVNNANFMSIKNSTIIDFIIQKMIKDNSNPPQFNGLETKIFGDHVLKSKNKVLFEMDNVCIHSQDLKKSSSQMINSFVVFP